MQLKPIISIITVLFLSTQSVYAEWGKLLNDVNELATSTTGSGLAGSALSNSEVVSGLKEALANGVETAVTTLGQSGGFLGNKAVEIAAPESLNTVLATARTLGQGHYIDELTTTMNRAAEQAVPEAAGILSDSIRDMSVDDAMKILNGSDQAATEYFRSASEAKLTEKFKPIISQATAQTGVTSVYKNLTDLSATPLLGDVLGTSNALDIDQYVTTKTLDGLFKYIGQQEQAIRSNPAARTTDLLQKVFTK